MKNYLEFERDIKVLEEELEKLKDPFNKEGISEVDTENISRIQKEIDQKLKKSYENLNEWQKTQVARHEERPKAKFFIENLFENFINLSGDRNFSEDEAIIAGFATFNKKSVLVLVPEISLTPQVSTRFRRAFGNRVALWHSRMTRAEKGWTWQKLKRGEYSIVIGARSAIFAPLKNLGLIIIDEEQETSYKQENPVPRYHARDVAMVRGKHAGATVLLTSATPSLESYYNC